VPVASDDPLEWLDRAREGDVVALGRLITVVETGGPQVAALRAAIHAGRGGSRRIGVTGAPGSGKSTLVGAIARELRARDRTVAIVAVDPSSSISGGAILGDRIRMSEHTLDEGIFVRSMSTRGRLGGVSAATVDAVALFDASGWDVVVIETAGVGQAEVDIVQIAETTAVVSVPGLGDDVQAIKAGLLEVADLHVVNKADRPEAERAVADLRGMLAIGGPPADPEAWVPPVLRTTALDGSGVAELVDAFDEHGRWLGESGAGMARRRAAAAALVREIARGMLADGVGERLADPEAERLLDAVAGGDVDPYAAAGQLLAGVAELGTPNRRS
jgi:LAO/AO transport system kinase